MPSSPGIYASAKQLVIAAVNWYFVPYRNARKLFFSAADFAEQVTDWELPRGFQRRHPAFTWIFDLFIWLPFTMLFSIICSIPALAIMTLAVVWPWIFSLVSFLLLNVIF